MTDTISLVVLCSFLFLTLGLLMGTLRVIHVLEDAAMHRKSLLIDGKTYTLTEQKEYA